jgi:hypothetical protein
MPDLADVIADAFAEADLHAEKVSAQYGDRLRELLEDPEQRDVDIWDDAFEAMDLDLQENDITLSELLEVRSADRDALWYATTSTVLAASKVQALVELVVRPMAEAGLRAAPQIRSEATGLDSDNKRTLAKAGIGKERWRGALERMRG